MKKTILAFFSSGQTLHVNLGRLTLSSYDHQTTQLELVDLDLKGKHKSRLGHCRDPWTIVFPRPLRSSIPSLGLGSFCTPRTASRWWFISVILFQLSRAAFDFVWAMPPFSTLFQMVPPVRTDPPPSPTDVSPGSRC